MTRANFVPLQIPLSAAAHQQALQLATTQADLVAGKRAYFNTLAVWAVQRYLSWLHIETDWASSDSGQAATQALFGVADLIVPNIGRLECCPLVAAAEAIALPAAALVDRVGYVVVQLESQEPEARSLNAAQILGFAVPNAVDLETGILSLNALQPLDQFPDYLHELESALLVPAARRVNLSEWLQQRFSAEWQAVEAVLGRSSVALAFRRATAVHRAKRIRGLSGENDLVLILTLISEQSVPFVIHVQVCAADASTALPADLQMRILTETGELFQEIVADDLDTFIQYEFTGAVGEAFQIELTRAGDRTVEQFVI